MKNLFLSILIISIGLKAYAQKQYSKAFSLINDNDLYISTSQDRYYTNGVFLKYSFATNGDSKSLLKKIYAFELGQKLYSPYKASVRNIAQHDRPFAGYLYLGVGVRNYYRNKSSFGFDLALGVIGPSAFGEQSMNFVHSLYGFDPADGWKYQIKDALGLNFRTDNQLSLGKTYKYFDLYWKNTANIGTVFTDISTGILGRIGTQKLQHIANSIGFGSNLNTNNSVFKNQSESFFYINPMIRYALYDATIQGSFLTENNPVTYDLEPWVFTTEFGFWFTVNRFNFKYMIVHHTNKLQNTSVSKENFYGGVQINYLFN